MAFNHDLNLPTSGTSTPDRREQSQSQFGFGGGGGSSSGYGFQAQDFLGSSGSGVGTPQLPSTPRPLRLRPLPLESPGIYDFMDPNLTPIDQELKAGGFGMFPRGVVMSPGESPSVGIGGGGGGGGGYIGGGGGGGGGGNMGSARGGPGQGFESPSARKDGSTGTMRDETMGEGQEQGLDQVQSLQGGLGMLNFSNTELEGYTSAQLYDLNQALLNDSVPTRPLIDVITPMSSLRAEYENGNNNFVKQIEWLIQKGFGYVRRTRGDGDCFYRSLAFAYIESLIRSSDKEMDVARALSTLAQTPELLDAAGIEKMVYEDFYEEVVKVIEGVVRPVNGEGVGRMRGRGETLDVGGLLKAFQDPETSNAVVIYLRFVTSAFIRMNPDQFEGFVVHPDTREPMDVESYCANFVQAMGKEADNVEIQALVGVLQLNVDVAYLNGGSADSVDFIRFRSDADKDKEPLVLLYRPGHYDVLSKTA